MLHIGSQSTTSQHVEYGHIEIGKTAIHLYTYSFDFLFGLILKANSTNKDPIWLGKYGVQASNDQYEGGFVLEPGDSIRLPVHDMRGLYAISTKDEQDLMWVGA